eukprot:COSAG06_NODE_60491_length_270_cov_1.970760_1_plen_76_part_01
MSITTIWPSARRLQPIPRIDPSIFIAPAGIDPYNSLPLQGSIPCHSGGITRGDGRGDVDADAHHAMPAQVYILARA